MDETLDIKYFMLGVSFSVSGKWIIYAEEK